MKCIDCKNKTQKIGHSQGKQRYKCKVCKRQFGETSKSKKEKLNMVKYYYKYGSLRKTAKKFKVSTGTLHKWVIMDRNDLDF